MGQLNGIDVSSYQAGLDLGNISYDFVLIKATEGTSYVNPYCDAHYQEALAADKKRGVYGFSGYGDAVAEANYFVDNCVGYIRDAIFMLDWEGSFVADVDWAKHWLDQVQARTGVKPVIYMSEWVCNNYDWSPVINADYGLVVAKYSDYEIDNNYDMTNADQPPQVNWGVTGYLMWQWTSKGRITGYAGDLDCDVFYGSPEAWDAYAGIASAPPAPLAPPSPTPPLPPAASIELAPIAPAKPAPTPPVTPPTTGQPDPAPVTMLDSLSSQPKSSNPQGYVPIDNNKVEVSVDPVSEIDHKDVWLRAGKTFIQAAIAAYAVNPGFSKGALLSVLAAAVSAAWNYIRVLLKY